MRTLFLATDAFGGHGGIAKCNRDLITAICLHEATTEVVAVPRQVINPLEPLPPKLVFVRDSLGGKRQFLTALARRLGSQEAFDLVLCGHINLLAPALVAAWRCRAPLILWVHGIEAWEKPSARAAARGCAYIDGFVSVSHLTARRFRSWARVEGKRHWVIPNAIQLDRFSPGPKSVRLIQRYGLQGKTVLATLARLVAAERMKGVDEVLELMPRLLRAHPDMAYLVMGDGLGKRRLEQKARDLGVAGNVVFAGRISEDEKVEHYRLADAFVMPSQGEGFGFVFLEAMACGIPVVASATDGGREAVREGALGTLVDPNSQNSVLWGIEEALAKPRGVVPMGLEYFAFEKFTYRVHSFLNEVTNANVRFGRFV